MNNFITTFTIGIFASIGFIVMQPLFGMLTLTSRHAAAYIEIGNYNAIVAIVLSWFVHVSVSIIYAFISLSIYKFNPKVVFSILQIIFLGWITTLIATPANEFVVKLITLRQFPEISTLSGLNTQIGPKFWLHILFFVLVILAASFSSLVTKVNEKKTKDCS